MINSKLAEETQVKMTELVLPQHTNNLGSIFGGVLMSWMDIAGAIAAQRYSGKTCVTASVDELHFLKPIRLGQVVNIQARVNCVHRSSCEVMIQVFGEDPKQRNSFCTSTAMMTFVALDSNFKPTQFQNDKKDSECNEEALERRAQRLKKRKELEKLI